MPAGFGPLSGSCSAEVVGEDREAHTGGNAVIFPIAGSAKAAPSLEAADGCLAAGSPSLGLTKGLPVLKPPAIGGGLAAFGDGDVAHALVATAGKVRGGVAYSDEVERRFCSKPNTDSAPRRTVIPIQGEQIGAGGSVISEPLWRVKSPGRLCAWIRP